MNGQIVGVNYFFGVVNMKLIRKVSTMSYYLETINDSLASTGKLLEFGSHHNFLPISFFCFYHLELCSENAAF